MANPGLAIFLSALGDAAEGFGQRIEKKNDFVQQAKMKQVIEELFRPREEAQMKRQLLLRQGFDPDTLEPIPGFFEAIKKRRSIPQARTRSSDTSDDDDVSLF